jgi:hypothetical protein
VVDSWERSFDAANQGTVAFNRKLIEIAQRNINSSFDPAKDLAGAKNFAKVTELRAVYWRKQLSTITPKPRKCEPYRIGLPLTSLSLLQRRRDLRHDRRSDHIKNLGILEQPIEHPA